MSVRKELEEVVEELEDLLPDLQQKQARYLDLMIQEKELRVRLAQVLPKRNKEVR